MTVTLPSTVSVAVAPRSLYSEPGVMVTVELPLRLMVGGVVSATVTVRVTGAA